MKKTLFLILTILIAVSCEKPRDCADGLVTYQEVKVEYASLVSFSFDSTIDLGGMNGDLQLNPSDATDNVIYTTGDLNLNGFTLTLTNVRLVVNGNLNGGGSVVTEGSKGSLCVRGAVQNSPDLSNASVGCSTLSNDDLDSFEEMGTECDLGRIKYVGSDRFKAVKFEAL